jgi:Arc/MetJ family transcription regulator
VPAAGERLDLQRLRVLPVDPVADPAQPREVAQVLRRSGSAGHLRILSIRLPQFPADRCEEGRGIQPGNRPTAWQRVNADANWYEFACGYADVKWKQASSKYRKDIARALTAATQVMLAARRAKITKAARRLMALTQIDIDEDALAEAMRLSGAKKETVNVALREFAARHRRIAALEHYATLAAGWDFEGWEHRRAAEKDPVA